MKRLIALCLSGAMLVSAGPLQVNASETSMNPGVSANEVVFAPEIAEEKARVISAASGSTVSKEPTDDALEKAIIAVKSKITIPKEYSEFDYNFYNASSYAASYWRLTWRNPDSNSYIRVECDMANHITYYRNYDYEKYYNGIPKYLKKELKDEAEQFIKKVAPEISGKLEYMDATFEGIYSGNYSYRFERKENGVAFPDNSVTISVNSVTGDVTSASINWLYDAKVPSADTVYSKKMASDILKKNMDMQLVYRSNYYRIYDEDGSNDSKIKAFLVYEPTVNYIAVDAKTGELYLTRSEWVEKEEYTADQNKEVANDSDVDGSADYGRIELTEEELKKLEELNQLISKEEAIKAITENKYLYIDKNLKSYSASLSKSYGSGEETSYVWNISLNDPREIDYSNGKDYFRAYASATVDAKTGNILSFHANLPDYYDEESGKWTEVAIPYDRRESQEILEKFLKSQIEDKFKNSKLVSQSDSYIVYYKNDAPVYGGYSYQYQRVNEDILYPYNSINGLVDGTNGKIYSFYYNWDDNIEFESPKGTITPEKAMEYYLDNEGYRLVYEVNQINIYDSKYESSDQYYDYMDAYSVDYEVRLVYRPDVNPSFISPFTGKQLNANGEEYIKTKPYTYKDVADTEENRDILLLSDMNIGFEGEYFEPQKSITKKDLLTLLEAIGYGRSVDEYNMNMPVTREEVAGIFIVRLGLDSISALKDIFKTGYADENEIDAKYIGSVALAKAFGLMEADGNNEFNPNSKVTRAEAVQLLFRFIKVSREGY